MALIDQITRSQLSKQGQTNPSGIFESKPANVAAALRGNVVLQGVVQAPPVVNPIDIIPNDVSQQTYLEYLKAANQL